MSFNRKNLVAAQIVCGWMRALLLCFDSLTGGDFPDSCRLFL